MLLSVALLAVVSALTPELTADATSYMEWMLDVRFTPADRDRYRGILEGMWRSGNDGATGAAVSMASAWRNMSALPESERNAKRERVQTEFVRLLSNATDDDSRWLLGLYQAGRRSDVPLTGRWTNGRVSMIQYENRYTGAPAPTNGQTFAWEFHADGTYSFTGLVQSVMYNCTTAMFSNETGRYTVNGSVVSLAPEKNPYRMTNNCAPSSNREAPGKVVPRSYRYRITGNNLELTGDDGATSTFQKSR
jgi:hypothetical protein